MIFNMVARGSGGLKFSILSYTSEDSLPASASENTIAIITDTNITSWIMATKEPSNPLEGMVWIKTGVSSVVEFNILTENNIQIYPLNAYQYIDGAWVGKTAKSFQNGAWVDWFVGDYLFNYGNQSVNITGGYTKLALKMIDTIDGAEPDIKESEDGSWTIGGDIGANNSGIVHTVNKIDLTNYTKLHFDGVLCDLSGNDHAGVGLWTGFNTWSEYNYISTNRDAQIMGEATANETEYVLDIADINGEYYIGFYVYWHSGSYVKVNRMWLE